jgi:hypothetical protein
MKNLIACLLSVILTLLPTGSSVAWAANNDKDEDRLKDRGTVLKEILDIPDNIPQDLLDKADCEVRDRLNPFAALQIRKNEGLFPRILSVSASITPRFAPQLQIRCPSTHQRAFRPYPGKMKVVFRVQREAVRIFL